jgi:hypothetical protein
MTFCLQRIFPPLLFALVSASAFAGTMECDNGVAVVHSNSDPLLAQMCQASDDAIEVMTACGLTPPSHIEITVRSKILAECLGVFHCGENRIEVLSPQSLSTMRDQAGVFAHLSADRMFQSVIVHEMAHAAFDNTPCPYENCVATSEYFAYAVQILELSDQERLPIVELTEEKGKVSRDAINAFVLFMAPDRFVTSVWAHLSTRPDMCGYLQDVQSGITVFDRFHP